MDHLDYIYRFSAIKDKLSFVKVTNLRRNEEYDVRLAVKDHQILLKRYHQMPAKIADFVDLAATVSIADRLSIQRAGWQRCIKIILPVRDAETLSTLQIVEHLKRILYWFTGDHWFFEFIPRKSYGQPAALQMCMPCMTETRQSVEVALWSGGLDSLAGLLNRLSENLSNHYVLFGTGASNIIHSTQQKVADAVNIKFPGHTTLVQLPVQLSHTENLPKNSCQRSRGFFFMLLGAVCAYMEGQNTLYIYENGIGAINLPFRDSEVGLDHSRAVHPSSLLYMSELLSTLLGQTFTFQNPFLFSTKAQMCEVLTSLDATDLVYNTLSCDQRRREQPTQCGCCSSCLLRRQALAASGVEIQQAYFIPSAYAQDRIYNPSDGDQLRAMLDQVATLRYLLSTDNPWYNLSMKYKTLIEIVDQKTKRERIASEKVIEALLQLYRRYVEEWESDNVQDIISQGLLEEWELRTAV